MGVSSGTAYRGVFKARTLPGVLALTLKDFKVIFRKSSMIAGLLIPVYFMLPQIFIALSKGEFSLLLATGLVFGLGWFSSIGADPVIKIDGKELDFLRTLPLTKKTFILSKSLTMSVIPAATGFVVIGMAYYYNSGQALYLISHAFILPLITSLTAMNYFYRYKGAGDRDSKDEHGGYNSDFHNRRGAFCHSGCAYFDSKQASWICC